MKGDHLVSIMTCVFPKNITSNSIQFRDANNIAIAHHSADGATPEEIVKVAEEDRERGLDGEKG